MAALDVLAEQMAVARRMVDLYLLLCNNRKYALKAPVRDRLMADYNVAKKHYADSVHSQQLRIVILRGPIQVDRRDFSPASLAFLLRQALVVGVSAMEAFFQEEYRDNCYQIYSSVHARIVELQDLLSKRAQPGRVPGWQHELEDLRQARILKASITLGDHLNVVSRPGQMDPPLVRPNGPTLGG